MDNINRNVYEITYTGQFKKDYKKYKQKYNLIHICLYLLIVFIL